MVAFCDLGANLSASNNEGISPVVAAASRGHLDVVRTLLDRGVDASEADENGRTPLAAAQLAEQSEVVAFLNNRGFS